MLKKKLSLKVKNKRILKLYYPLSTATRYMLVTIFPFYVLARTTRYTHVVLLANVGSYIGEY